MKFGPVTTLDRKNTAISEKKMMIKSMSVNCDAIVTFPIYGSFGAIQMPNYEAMVCRTYPFINSSYKNWKQKEKISNKALMVQLGVKVLLFT